MVIARKLLGDFGDNGVSSAPNTRNVKMSLASKRHLPPLNSVPEEAYVHVDDARELQGHISFLVEQSNEHKEVT